MTRRYGRGDGDDRGKWQMLHEKHIKGVKNRFHPPAHCVVVRKVSNGRSDLILTGGGRGGNKTIQNNETMSCKSCLRTSTVDREGK